MYQTFSEGAKKRPQWAHAALDGQVARLVRFAARLKSL